MNIKHRRRLLPVLASISLIAAACVIDGSTVVGEPASCGVSETDGDLTMFNRADYIDDEELAAFGDEFGVNLTLEVYDSDEAMQSIISDSDSGFDLIVPSDYMVTILIGSGNLQPLNKDAIPNFSNLLPDFSEPSYDPGAIYSAPYQWGTTGIAVNTAVLGRDFDRSWGLIFDPTLAGQFEGQITLLDDPRETMGAALRYLGYSLNSTSQAELDEARDLISATRENLATFETDQADEMLVNGETVIAHGHSGDMFVQFIEADEPSDFEFFVPEEGGARRVDAIAIPVDAPHPCTATTFINWLLSAEHGAALSNWNHYATPNEAALDILDQELIDFITNPDIVVSGEGSLEQFVDTGDFEINYTDAFSEAKG